MQEAKGREPPLTKRRKGALLPAVVITVMASLAVAGYLFLQGTSVDGLLPSVFFSPVSRNAGNVTVDVASVSPHTTSTQLADLKSRLSVDGVQRASLDPMADGASDWVLAFHDRDRSQTLSGGDRFLVDIVAPGDYELTVLFEDHIVARAAWTI